MKELQEITDAWGRWFANQNGHTLHFTASTKFSGNWHLDRYHQYQTKVENLPDSLRYGPPRDKGVFFGNKMHVVYHNESAVQQNHSESFTYEKVDSLEWSITEGLKIGVDTKLEAQIPFFFKGSSTLKTEINLSSTQKSSASNKVANTKTFPVTVPPYTTIDFEAESISSVNECDWQASALLSGHVAVRFNEYFHWDTDKPHALWFIPIDVIFKDVSWNSIIDITGYHVTNKGVEVTARGTCTAMTDTTTTANAKEIPYNCNSIGKSSTYLNDVELEPINNIS